MFKVIICICQPCRELFAPWCVVRFPNPLATGMTFTAVGEPDYMVRHNWSQQQQSNGWCPHWNLLLHSQYPSAPIRRNFFCFIPTPPQESTQVASTTVSMQLVWQELLHVTTICIQYQCNWKQLTLQTDKRNNIHMSGRTHFIVCSARRQLLKRLSFWVSTSCYQYMNIMIIIMMKMAILVMADGDHKTEKKYKDANFKLF